jgi:hypothetical protein
MLVNLPIGEQHSYKTDTRTVASADERREADQELFTRATRPCRERLIIDAVSEGPALARPV